MYSSEVTEKVNAAETTPQDLQRECGVWRGADHNLQQISLFYPWYSLRSRIGIWQKLRKYSVPLVLQITPACHSSPWNSERLAVELPVAGGCWKWFRAVEKKPP